MKTTFIYLLCGIVFLMTAKGLGQTNGKTYYIQSAIGNKHLDVKWGKSDNGTPLHLWPYNGGAAQKFTLENAGNGYFYIKSGVGKYLHVSNSSRESRALPIIWQGKGPDNGKWKFINAPNGYKLIQSKMGTYLDVQWAKADDGTPIWMWRYNGGTAQRWKLIEVTNTSSGGISLTLPEAGKTKPILYNYNPGLLKNVVLINVAKKQTEASSKQYKAEGPNLDSEPYSVFLDLDMDLRNRFDHNESSYFSRIHANLIPDKEPGSGVFYYRPHSYNLDWDKDMDKHNLQITYSRKSEGREEKSARVKATLTSGITVADIHFFEGLIKQLLKSPQLPNPKVQLKPLAIESPSIKFEGGGFDISEDQISIVSFSDFSKDIEMSFTTSDDNIDALKSGGLQNKISFGLEFAAKGHDVSDVIPANISIMDEEAYGIFEVDFPTLPNVKNPTPYPIKLQYLHVMTTEKNSEGTIIPFIYSFELGNKTARPKDILNFKKPSGFVFPNDLKGNKKPLRAFVEYRLLDCESCTQNIINDLTGGLTAATKQEIKFQSVNLLQATGAKFVWVFLKSEQLDPGKQQEIAIHDPIEIDADSDYVKSPTMYLYNSEQPTFDYKVWLVMPDGTIHKMNEWIQGDALRVLLTEPSLKNHFTEWPKTTQDDESDEEN